MNSPTTPNQQVNVSLAVDDLRRRLLSVRWSISCIFIFLFSPFSPLFSGFNEASAAADTLWGCSVFAGSMLTSYLISRHANTRATAPVGLVFKHEPDSRFYC